MKAKTLSTKNLVALFGVTAMTVYNWKKGGTNKPAMPAELTPGKVKRWAEKNGVTMTCQPDVLLGVGAGKPGPKPRLGEGLAMLAAYSSVPEQEPRRAKAGPKALLCKPVRQSRVAGMK